MMLAEINWNNFKTKFSGQEQSAFEKLCYLLFCNESGKKTGISRFKNHAGIETDPIEADGQFIGWQAKFYDSRLSEHKAEIIGAIDTAKERHPQITQIIFYTNQDFGQDAKRTTPQYKTEIETHATAKGIQIVWRTASYFESPFVREQNFSIAQHYFSLSKGIIDSIAEIALATKEIFNPIRSEIAFDSNRIKIDRTPVIDGLKDLTANPSVVILSGNAGVGKTAAVKDFHDAIKETALLYVFKATQLKNASILNELFKSYGEITAAEFIQEHKGVPQKYVVIDSAERLAEVEDQGAFRSLLSSFIENNWNVIFTVRHSYLDDLRYQLKEIYSTGFASLEIPVLSLEELEQIAKDKGFSLPRNARVLDLLRTPLYLGEYLKNYASVQATTSYADFRDIIWKKQIQDSTRQAGNIHRRRESCFLAIAKRRANDGGFFVAGEDLDQDALQKLGADEIIKYDENARGYFITHDVYEEWALDKLIEQSFVGAKEFRSFYAEIGSSLPIRRAFRNWLSDKLFADRAAVQRLVEFTVKDASIESHWKDEVLVSVLLSDYSVNFFQDFERQFLEDDGKLLTRILFLLRVSCKTVDENLLILLGIKAASGVALNTVFTVPKGTGWESAIAFVNTHREQLQLKHMRAILPVLSDWTRRQIKDGAETTRHASQMALFYYEELTKREGFYFGSRDDSKDRILGTIISGSGEIKSELTEIVNKILAKGDAGHRGQYYDLSERILGSVTESAEIAAQLPKEVLKLAELFWMKEPEEDRDSYGIDLEIHFALSRSFRYYPASAFQTPIYVVLRNDFKAAIDFILSFTNKSIEFFAKSRFAKNEVEEIDIVVDSDGTTVKQYVCHRIWNLYRGTQTAPNLLESIHMALEKWLLSVAKSGKPEVIESWCLYLLRNSHSASITAIVTSVVLAESSKLFNLASILFRTKDLFFFDMVRWQLDQSAKGLYQIASEGIFKNERIQTCEDVHRSQRIEYLALSYQFFATEGEGEDIAKKRQEVIWMIFDEYYKLLPDKSAETDSDKTWRLCLARMDRRKMAITTEAKDEGIHINFNPDIDPDLKNYSEESQAKATESMKHLALLAWARNRLEGKPNASKYPQYDSDPKNTLAEARQILEGLTNDQSEDKTFTLFNHSTPSIVCSVLMRDFFDNLDEEEKELCEGVLIESASMPFKEGYQYQIGDGVKEAISSLPLLLKLFPEDSKGIKIILLMTLFDSYPIDMNQKLSDYPMAAILNSMWKDNPDDANSIFIGLLVLKPLYDALRESIRRENYEHNVHELANHTLLERFYDEYAGEVEKVASNAISYSDIPDINKIDLDTLVNAFCLIPINTTNPMHKTFMHQIFPIFADKLFRDDRSRDRDDHFNYGPKHRFLEKLALIVLSSEGGDTAAYLKPFLDGLRESEGLSELFSEFVSVEDRLARYEQFWETWNLFYPKVVELAKKDSRRRSGEIIRNYLLAWKYWREDAKEWHTLKDREKLFFKRAAEDMGQNPTVLYSISKLLNGIGSGFQEDGILWICDMLAGNPDLSAAELEVNTVYYLENLVRNYVIKNRHRIKTTLELKTKILVLLDFLLEKGSAAAYLLREDIL